ncbi:LOW QUALITY PROTEIN: serine protease 48, partial [Ctenodactylus gundi]
CEQPIYSGRIVGGHDATAGHWRWQVSLRFSQNHICGSSLISDRWTRTFLYSVWMGSTEADYSGQVVEYHVSQVIIHPKSKEKDADIAFLKLSSRVSCTSLIMPICLPNVTKQLTIPASFWVSRWGKVKKDDDYPSTLQEAEVSVISHQACERLCNPVGIFFPALEPVIKGDMICTGDRQTGTDSCKGDGGWGALSCRIAGIWTQTGLVSWGMDCGKTLKGVYTNMIYYQLINATISRANLGAKNLDLSDFLIPIILLSLALLGLSWAFGPSIIGEQAAQ